MENGTEIPKEPNVSKEKDCGEDEPVAKKARSGGGEGSKDKESAESVGPSSMSSTSSAAATPAQKYIERMKRLRDLHSRRNEARQMNQAEVVEEDRKQKLPPNHEMKQMRQEWELHEYEKQKEAEESGLDYERVKLMETQSDIAEKLEAAKKRKKNPDTFFKDFETMTFRTYQRNTRNIKHNSGDYATMRNAMGEAFFPTSDTMVQGTHYPDQQALERLSEDTIKAKEKRLQFRREREEDHTHRVDYINEKNKRFNRAVERFYGEYTEEIKQSLERGTAI